MNFRPAGRTSVILMSLRPGAPYADRVEEGGRVLVYEGHDAPNTAGGPDPKTVDQPEYTPAGSLTQNGQFAQAARAAKLGRRPSEPVKVYEKLRTGIWVYNGVFSLLDAWQETSDGRRVFKFRLELERGPTAGSSPTAPTDDLANPRMIPPEVKLQVWKRDGGRCVVCGSQDNLHFDHVVPYSRGGSSLVASNIQLLCARHNIGKGSRIQ